MDRDLLDVATLLISDQPIITKQALLRRAASTAYYAVFQALASRCASTLVTYRGTDWDTYTLAYRALDHQSARKLFERSDITSAFGSDIATFASAFVNLQRARILADYVPQPFPYGRVQVAELIEQARNACHIVDRIPTPLMRKLAAQLVFKSR
jgi:hypothetical protein